MNHHYPHATGVFFWGNTGTPPIFRAQTQTRSLSSNSSAVLCSIPISEWARGVSQRLLTQPSTCPCPSLWLIIMSFNYQWIGWREKPYFFPKKTNPLKLRSMISSELWKFHSIGISGCVDVKVRGDLLYTKKRAFTTGCQSKWDVTCTEKIE